MAIKNEKKSGKTCNVFFFSFLDSEHKLRGLNLQNFKSFEKIESVKKI